MKKIGLLLPLPVLLQTTQALADLTKIADGVYSYVGEKDASPARSFAANAGIVISRTRSCRTVA